MMKDKDFKILLREAKSKVDRTMLLVAASLEDLGEYETDRTYSPKELEPYDALTDRFIRGVEMFAKFFKTYDAYHSIDGAPTYRDLINMMEKLKLVTNASIWMKMRDVRNRIVHDYLPEQTRDMYDSIMGEFYTELRFSSNAINGTFE